MLCSVNIAWSMPAEFEVEDNMDTQSVTGSELTLCNSPKMQGKK